MLPRERNSKPVRLLLNKRQLAVTFLSLFVSFDPPKLGMLNDTRPKEKKRKKKKG